MNMDSKKLSLTSRLDWKSFCTKKKINNFLSASSDVMINELSKPIVINELDSP